MKPSFSSSLDLRNHLGERLDFSWHPARAGGGLDRVALLAHGVTGNKDRPHLVALANALGDAGVSSLRFSFSGNGESEGAFVDSTISKEVEEVRAVIDQLATDQVIYIGHSMGAAVGVLCASRDTRIRRLVSLAGMTYTAEFARREFGETANGGRCMWDKPECPLSDAFLKDMAAIDSVVAPAQTVSIPWLLVHGTSDDVVPPGDSRVLAALPGGQRRIHIIEGSDHLFSGEACDRMVQAVTHWVTQD